MTDQVVIQSPANNGTLAATGSLGVDAGANAGADITGAATAVGRFPLAITDVAVALDKS